MHSALPTVPRSLSKPALPVVPACKKGLESLADISITSQLPSTNRRCVHIDSHVGRPPQHNHVGSSRTFRATAVVAIKLMYVASPLRLQVPLAFLPARPGHANVWPGYVRPVSSPVSGVIPARWLFSTELPEINTLPSGVIPYSIKF